jgi:hypothetical protein
MNCNLDAEKLVTIWEDRRAVQNVMGIFSCHYLLKREKDIVAELFSDRDDISLATNDGYYTGRDAVVGYYEAIHQKNLLTTSLIMKKYPEKFQDKTPEEAYGCGLINYKPLDTPVVEIAGDGATARGIWTCRNSYSDLRAAGPVAFYEWGWVAADFVKEGEAWKIWHLQIIDDVHVQAGLQYNETEKPYPPVPGFEAIADFKMPEPTVKTTVRALYSTDRPRTAAPEVPEPYETFDPAHSYGWQ